MASHQVIARKLADAVEIAAAAASPGWSTLLLLSRGCFDGEVKKEPQIGLCPCRATEPHELVKIDFNLEEGFAPPEGFITAVLEAIDPFIVGVGEIRSYRFAKGIVLVRADDRDGENSSHGFAPSLVGTT